jgi:L-asparaginase II
VALDADGSVRASAGDVEGPMLPRSCNKPIQALGMLEAGLDLKEELLALACASHSGEPFHIEAVRRILASVGLSEDALQTPPGYPLDDEVREQLIRSGGSQAPVLMNCSGKHAAMLATCAANDWPVSSYLEADHPLQQAIAATFQRMTGEPAQVAVDGCGAPLLSTSLTGLARAFSRLATGGFETLAGARSPTTVGDAMRAHPEFVSGTRRDELTLMRAIPGAIGKAGAESAYAVALPDGRAFATKTDDGAPRARPVLMAALLERLGITEEAGVDGDAVRRTGESVLLGGGRPVGEIRAVVAV